MNISIIVPCFNEENNIGDCLETLVDQEYSLGAKEIIVIDGGSKDNTANVVKGFAEKYDFVRFIVEKKKGVAAGRNAGIIKATSEYIAFIDADCLAPDNWLQILAENYLLVKQRDNTVIAVGGSNIPPPDADSFLQAIAIASDSYAGSFNSVQGRLFREQTYVKSLATLNAVYEKQKLLGVDCFDESLLSDAEDADMNYRLSNLGNRFMFIPRSFVWHKMRPTPLGWFKNMFRYGKGRARLLKRYPTMWNLSFVLPILFICAFFSVGLFKLSNIFFMPFLYFPLILCFSFFQALRKKQLQLSLNVMLVYMIQHFGYALGEIFGLCNPKIK